MLLTTSGTTALEMASILADLQSGDEVIAPSFTFSSTINAFLLRGANVVFCDIREDTFNIDENKIEELTEKPFGPNDFKFTTNQIWTVYPDGSIELQSSVTSNRPNLVLPRLGYVMKVPEKYSNFSYYGRGPVENYPDRKTGQFIEVYNSTVADEFVRFPKPQDMGNHEDIRWCALTNKEGEGIYSNRTAFCIRSAILCPGPDAGFSSSSIIQIKQHLPPSGCSSNRIGRKQLRSGRSATTRPCIRQQPQLRFYNPSCRKRIVNHWQCCTFRRNSSVRDTEWSRCR